MKWYQITYYADNRFWKPKPEREIKHYEYVFSSEKKFFQRLKRLHNVTYLELRVTPSEFIRLMILDIKEKIKTMIIKKRLSKTGEKITDNRLLKIQLLLSKGVSIENAIEQTKTKKQ